MVWGTFCALALKPTGNGPKTERLACRGGRYISGANAGFFALLVRTTREMHAPSLGFRPAFASDVGSPMVMAVGTERGKRGPFPPRCKTGKSQQPRVASRQRKRRGAIFVRWPVPIGNGPQMERLACRGGYYNTVGSGLFALILNDLQTYRHRNRGFRPAFAPDVGSPMVTAVRTKQGKRGLFPPQAKGK